jgi:hypothetical protein
MSFLFKEQLDSAKSTIKLKIISASVTVLLLRHVNLKARNAPAWSPDQQVV